MGTLPDLTYYRLPDVYPAAATFSGLLTAIYTSLTSPVDYRGNTIPSTHLWTWATASVGVVNAVYNTSIPSDSGVTRNFAIIFAASGTAAPTMATPDTFTANVVNVGINTDTGSYVSFTNAIPMTNGTFTGFWRAAPVSLNATGTLVRSYVSQESIFIKLTISTLAQTFLCAGAIYEPYVGYNSGSNLTAAQPDGRILGIISSGQSLSSAMLSANNVNSYTYHNTGNGQSHAGYLRPYFNTFSSATRQMTYTNIASGGERDLAGNWIFETLGMYDSRQITFFRIGNTRNLYALGMHEVNTTTIRSGSTDLYHQLSYDVSASSQTIALKAAP